MLKVKFYVLRILKHVTILKDFWKIFKDWSHLHGSQDRLLGLQCLSIFIPVCNLVVIIDR